MIVVRRLDAEELGRVQEIDVSERGEIVYYYRAGVLQAEPESWQRKPRTSAAWAPQVEDWQATLTEGGAAIGAFDGERLVGIAVLRDRLRLQPSTAQLSALFVSASHRRQGVAACLVNEIVRLAHATGAHTLYVSATPSVSAVGFYLSQGFALAAQVDPDLFALEPEDIHLTRPLTRLPGEA